MLSDAASDEMSLSASWLEASMLWMRSATSLCRPAEVLLSEPIAREFRLCFKKEDLVVKGLQDRRDLVFGTAHGAHVSGLARLCVAQHDGVLRLQFAIIHGIDFTLPLLEQIVAHLVDGLDLVVELARLRVRRFRNRS